MDILTGVRVFCAIVELRSFTAAAERLGLSPAMASKHVSYLEKRLGARLLNRTSRNVSTTEAGAIYFSQAKHSLDSLDAVEAAITNVTLAPSGTLKVSLPVWAASTFMAAILAEYHSLYPDVTFDFDFSSRIVNLVEEGFDLALRATSAERLDPGLVAKPLADVTFQLVGSPRYIAIQGRPTSIEDLENHALLAFAPMVSNGTITLITTRGPKGIRCRPVLQTGNETMLHVAALNGLGLAFLPAWMTATDVAEGALEVLMPSEYSFSATLYAVYPSRKFLSAKVRSFIDFLAARKFGC